MSWNYNLPPGCRTLPGEECYPDRPLQCRKCGAFVKHEPDCTYIEEGEGIIHAHRCKRCGAKTPTSYYA